MANGGWYGTKEEWERVEKPLLDVDSIIEKFANSVSQTVDKNHKDCPERSITWGSDKICLIQLFPADLRIPTFNLWLSIHQDRDYVRYSKDKYLIQSKRICEFNNDLYTLLEEGYQKLIEWSNDAKALNEISKLRKENE